MPVTCDSQTECQAGVEESWLQLDRDDQPGDAQVHPWLGVLKCTVHSVQMYSGHSVQVYSGHSVQVYSGHSVQVYSVHSLQVYSGHSVQV